MEADAQTGARMSHQNHHNSGKQGAPPASESAGQHDEIAQFDERAQRLATLGILAGSIAHEVNNILTPMLSYAQLALQNPADVELTEKALSKTISGAEKAGHIMSSLLGFVRADDAGRVSLVNECAHEAIACLEPNLVREGISIRFEIEEELAAKISPIALQQVILNLVLNPRDAIQPGKGELTIRAKRSTWNIRQHPDSPAVEISVEDSGCGMDEAMLESAFLPFVSNRRNTSNGTGTGLGLPICKQLIEEVGGSITASSERGVGTRFTIVLDEINPADTKRAA